jgi:hypothetical protein
MLLNRFIIKIYRKEAGLLLLGIEIRTSDPQPLTLLLT